MNKITFPLKLHMKRPEVAHLHEALALLGSTIADAAGVSATGRERT